MKEWKKPQISDLNLEATKDENLCPASQARGYFDITCCYHYCKKCGGCKNSYFGKTLPFGLTWICEKACTCGQGS